jgi:hypothetical protein
MRTHSAFREDFAVKLVYITVICLSCTSRDSFEKYSNGYAKTTTKLDTWYRYTLSVKGLHNTYTDAFVF